MALQSKFSGVAVVGIAALAGLAAALLWHHSRPAVELTTGSYLSPNRALPDFSLIDQNGQNFGPARLRGHWTLLFFGYTNCPDFCPTTLTTLAALDKRLVTEGFAARPQVVFMSVDAKRDTPAQLAKYVPYFNPNFLGVTAPDQAAADEAARKFGVAAVITPQADGTYTVDHSSALFVLNPQGELAAILTGPFTVEALRMDFERIVDTPA